MKNNFSNAVAYRVLDLLDERKARLYDDRKSFYVWPRDGRLMIIFDPSAVDGGKVNEDFAHRLSTRLQGRKVVRTNSRGLFLQVGYEIPPMPLALTAQTLELSRQPSPFHMPIGNTEKGELWRSLLDAVSIFVVGVSGMGKSALVHGFIQALLHGDQTLVYAWDGKNNAEYLRYVGRKNFTLFPMNGLQEGLKALESETQERWRVLARSGAPNIVEYNKTADTPMMPLALVIDEVAEVDNQAALVRHVKVNRAAGLFPIFATNDPMKSSVIAKSNLQTRISFSVVSAIDSVTGLGRSGAQKIPKVQGRGLIEDGGRLVEFQSFVIPYPNPTEAGFAWLESVMQEPTEAEGKLIIEPTGPTNEVMQLAESIRDQWTSSMSKRETAKLLGKTYAGWWKDRTDQVVEYLGATTTSKGADLAGFTAELA